VCAADKLIEPRLFHLLRGFISWTNRYRIHSTFAIVEL